MKAMGTRRTARERALQLLYALEYSQKPFDETERDFIGSDSKRRKSWSAFARELARKTWDERESLDAEIAPALEGWTIERLPIMDRLCLRLALSELRYFPDIPLRATINEAIEMAKIFGEGETPKFVNAVLDRLGRAHKHKDFGGEEKEDEIEGGANPDPAEQGAQPQP